MPVSQYFLQTTPQIFLSQGRWESNVPLGARGSFLHGGIEEGIAKEIQGAAENNTGVVPGLESRDQEGVLPNRVRVLKGNAFRTVFSC